MVLPPPTLETFLLSMDNIFETFWNYGHKKYIITHIIYYYRTAILK